MKATRMPDGYEPTTDWNARLGIPSMPNGSYHKDSSGAWCVKTPNGRYGSLAKHTVTEHEDGTITVSPSILVDPIEPTVYAPDERARVVALAGEDYAQEWERGKQGWHGFLERDVWREC